MITTQNNIAGSAVFWTLGEQTDHAKLSQAFRQAGLSKFVPEQLTNYAALRDTLTAEHPGCEVFPVKGVTDTFEVVRIVRDKDAPTAKNKYETVLTARATRYNTVEVNDATAPGLTDKFQTRKKTVAYHALTRALVEIVYSLGGTTLRPSGGFYWIPNANCERWEMIAQAIESAGPKNTCFALRTILDEKSAAVLREALAQEIAREAKEIDDTLTDPKTGLKAARTAKDRAKALQRKLTAYEASFQMSLQDLRKTLDEAVGIEAKATLLDIASQGPLLAFAS